MSFDHGVLNVPNRLGTIDAQLDRYKAEQHRNQRITAKHAAEQRRTDKVMAAALLAEHQSAILTQHGARFGIKPLKDRLASMAKWEPARLVDFINKFLNEQVAHEHADLRRLRDGQPLLARGVHSSHACRTALCCSRQRQLCVGQAGARHGPRLHDFHELRRHGHPCGSDR